MSFFANPLGLLALLALPAILAIHLYRRRFRERRVAGLFLFPRALLAADSGRVRTRLLRSWSLWFELLAALALALLAAGLTCGARGRIPHAGLVLDDSASMGAVGARGAIAERARAAARARLGDLGSGALATVVVSGARPEIAAGPRAPRGDAEAALEAWQPRAPSHDLALALALARDLGAPGDPRFVFTDDPALAAEGFEVVAVGEPLPNAAIVNARRERSGAGETLLVDLRLFAEAPLATALAIRAAAGGAELARRAVELEPGRTVHLALPLAAGAPAILLELDPDALAIDGTAIVLPEPRRVVRSALLVADEVRDLALLDRVLRAMEDVETVGDPSAADLVFSPGPGALRSWQTEVVLVSAGATVSDWIGPFLLERRHPLAAGIALDGVVWSAPDGPLPGTALVLAGAQPLLSEEVEGSAARVWLALDPSRSNLPDAPDWPILVNNLVESARARLPGPLAVNLRLGDSFLYRRESGVPPDAELSVEGPGGARERARGGWVASSVPREPGLHRLLDGERELAAFSVRFVDGAESDLCGRGSAIAKAAVAAGGVDDHGAPGRTEGRVLALLALLLVLGDWLVLLRRARAP